MGFATPPDLRKSAAGTTPGSVVLPTVEGVPTGTFVWLTQRAPAADARQGSASPASRLAQRVPVMALAAAIAAPSSSPRAPIATSRSQLDVRTSPGKPLRYGLRGARHLHIGDDRVIYRIDPPRPGIGRQDRSSTRSLPRVGRPTIPDALPAEFDFASGRCARACRS
jgi:hypothetical protein